MSDELEQVEEQETNVPELIPEQRPEHRSRRAERSRSRQQSARMQTTRWRSQVRRLVKLSEAQAALGWAIILILATLIGTIYLIQASVVAETGRRIQILQEELAILKRDNSIIERQIAESQSLSDLQDRALRLGFVPANPAEIDYIVVPDYPATTDSFPIIEPTATPKPEAIETMREAVQLATSHAIRRMTEGESRR